MRVDLSQSPRVFADVLPEDPNAHLEDVLPVAGDKLVVVYKRDVKDELYIYNMDGTRLTRVAPDFVGTVNVGGRRNQPWFFGTLTGFTNPGIIAKYDFEEPDEEKRWSVYRTTLLKGLKAEDFDSRQVRVFMGCTVKNKCDMLISRCGTRARMARRFRCSLCATKILHLMELHLPSSTVRQPNFLALIAVNAELFLIGYGGFTISINPFFSASMLTFLQRYGAVLAVPNIRGGGEFGEEWHLAGTRERKVRASQIIQDISPETQSRSIASMTSSLRRTC